MKNQELDDSYRRPDPAVPSPPQSSPQSSPLRTSCDQCKRAKIKCQRPDLQSCCASCTARGTTCTTTPVLRKPPAKKVNRQENILEIESRIARMESLLVSSGLSTPDVSDIASNKPSSDQEDLSARLSTLIVDDKSGISQFWGPSSSFSLFSPQGLEWVAEKTGTDELQGFLADLGKSRVSGSSSRVAKLWSYTPYESRAPLPPRAVADSYIRRFFGSLNNVIPLFDQGIFMQLYEQQYSSNPPAGPAWYAALNIVFAIGGTLTDPPEKHDSTLELALNVSPSRITPVTSEKYFKNACGVFAELIFTAPSILAVQALVGMCFVLESTLNAQVAYTVLASAVRLAHTIGLHRRIVLPQSHGLSQAEIKQRRNVFWILYVLENSMAIRLGRPPTISDDEIDIQLPQRGEYVDDALAEDDKFDTFYHQILLSRIESEIYTALYSVRSQKKSADNRLKSIADIDQKLQAWREDLPLKVRPGQKLLCPNSQIIQMIMLHSVYYNCITTLHRAPSHCALWSTNPSTSDNFNNSKPEMHHRVYASQQHCINAARSTGQLFTYFDQQKLLPQAALIRLVIFYPFSAFLTLFANILQNPNDSYVEADSRLMNIIANFFSDRPAGDDDTPLELAGKIFQKLNSIVTKFLAKTTRHKSAMKRRFDTVQDDAPEGSDAYGFDDAANFYEYGNAENMASFIPPNQVMLEFDESGPRFDGSQAPPFLPFISLDLGNIEWDSFLFL